jgi:hypothetical protein
MLSSSLLNHSTLCGLDTVKTQNYPEDRGQYELRLNWTHDIHLNCYFILSKKSIKQMGRFSEQNTGSYVFHYFVYCDDGIWVEGESTSIPSVSGSITPATWRNRGLGWLGCRIVRLPLKYYRILFRTTISALLRHSTNLLLKIWQQINMELFAICLCI